LLTILASTKVFPSGFDNGIINFNYNFPEYGYQVYGPGPGAIGSAGDFWNTADTTSVGEYISPLSLFNASGAATSVQWSYVGGGGIASGYGGTYDRLVNISTVIESATITGLTPNQQYNLYLFETYDQKALTVNGVGFTDFAIQPGMVNTLTAGFQYDVHTVTADSSGTLTFAPVSSTFEISSWQLTPVPEPSVLGLLAAGGIALLVCQRRNLLRCQAAYCRITKRDKTSRV
jgi:hypothetical protein